MKNPFRLLFLAVPFLFSGWAQAQEFSTIVSKDGILTQSIQGFASKDSLFIFFSTAGKKNFVSVLVTPDGKQQPLEIPDLKNKIIANVHASGTQLHFDFFDTNGNATIKRLTLDQATSAKTTLSSVSLSGRVIGYDAHEDTITVLTYDDKAADIHLQQFKNLNQIFSKNFQANPQLFKEKVTYISPGDITSASDAGADIKLYRDKKSLWILAENHENKAIETCTVFKIDIQTGTTTNKAIFHYSGEKWSTMLSGELILKVIKSKGITLEAYNLERTEPIFTTSFKEGSPVSKERAYERRGVNNEVFAIDVQQSLKAWGRPIVVPLQVRPDSILLKIGNCETQVIPKTSGFTALASVFHLARIPSYLFNQRVSVDRYFYLKGNFQTGFKYESNPETIEKVIDDRELTNRQKPAPINFKGYVRSGEATFGIYKFEKHYDQMKIERFETR